MKTKSAAKSAENPSFLASGVIGVKVEKAGEVELIRVARKWATDQSFRTLIVRHVDDRNFGFHFTYLSNKPNKEKIDACIAGLKETFGSDCIHRLDIASQPVVLDSTNSPVIALRGVPKRS